jgi:hypothetical protein
MIYAPLDDRELALFRGETNAEVRDALESVAIFDPASLDACPANALPPPTGMLVDDALKLCDERASQYAPWEIIL